MQRHAPVMTFTYDATEEQFWIKTACVDGCQETAAIKIPLAHLVSFAVAIVAVCGHCGIDLSEAVGNIAFLGDTAEERQKNEARLAEYLKHHADGGEDDET